MKNKITILLLILIAVPCVYAQEEIYPVENQSLFMIGGSFQTWKTQDYVTPINQFSFPMALIFPIGEQFKMTIIHSPAISWWDQNHRLSGLSDTWINGTYVFWSEKGMLSMGLGAPTGKTRLTNTEYELSQSWLSKNVFRYNLPVYGQGLSVKVGTAYAIPLGQQVIFGFGGQYIYHASYIPVAYSYTVADEVRIADEEFNPGDETNLHFGMDIIPHENMKLMFDAIHTQYNRDIFSGSEVYGSGAKWTIDCGLYYRFRQHFFWTHLQYRQQGKNELLQGLSIEEESLNTNGAQVDTDMMVKIFNYQNGALFALWDGRFYGKNEVDQGGATIVGLGTGGEFQISDRTKIDFHFKYLVGFLFNQDVKTRVEGLDTRFTMTLAF